MILIIISFSKGIFYDDSYENIEDFVSYAVEAINNLLYEKSSIQFEYFITKIDLQESVKLINLGIN